MLLISDLEKIAIDERRKLVREFEEKYADLREKVYKVPNSEIDKIVQKLNCPPELARVAYCIEMDGVLNIKESVDLLIDELQRRTRAGSAVANVSSHLLDFAIKEGKWIEYLYRTFSYKMESNIREISNNESKIKREHMSAETAMSVFQNRQKVAEAYVLEVMKRWLDEHARSKPIDAVIALGLATTRWTRDILHNRIRRLIHDLIEFMRRIEKTLEKEEMQSRALKYIIDHVKAIIEGLTSGTNNISELAGAHLVVHLSPKPDIKPDRSEIVMLSAPYTRGGLVEANMDSPADFLERDVKLAARRPEPARSIYLKKQLSVLTRYLYHKKIEKEEIVNQVFEMLHDRFNLSKHIISSESKKIKSELLKVEPSERFDLFPELMTQFIIKYIIERDKNE